MIRKSKHIRGSCPGWINCNTSIKASQATFLLLEKSNMQKMHNANSNARGLATFDCGIYDRVIASVSVAIQEKDKFPF